MESLTHLPEPERKTFEPPGLFAAIPLPLRDVKEADAVLPEADRKVPEPTVQNSSGRELIRLLKEPAAQMSAATNTKLRAGLPGLVSIVDMLSTQKCLNIAWLLASAVEGYTGNAKFNLAVIKAVGITRFGENLPLLQPNLVNQGLRGDIAASPQVRATVALFEEIATLPDIPDERLKPTRMLKPYPLLEHHFQIGNVLQMAEVGSVSRHVLRNDDLYKYKYRLEVHGGLKDFTAINRPQAEVLYAPGTIYEIMARRTGKVKEKKGNQAHQHVEMRRRNPGDSEVVAAKIRGNFWDLRAAGSF